MTKPGIEPRSPGPLAKGLFLVIFNTHIHRHTNVHPYAHIYMYVIFFGGARGVMVIVVGNGHGDTSSNPGRD